MLYLFPPLLIICNYLFFRFIAGVMGDRQGYLAGMIFYWVFWCILPALLFISRSDRKLLLKIKRLSWWQACVLIIPVILALLYRPSMNGATPLIISLSLVYAIVNAFSEQLFWRGVYFVHHQGNFFYAVIVPSIWFGIWHYAPLSIQPGFSGNFYFILQAIGMGICWGIVTFYTRSIFWSIISHALVGLSSMGALYFFR